MYIQLYIYIYTCIYVCIDFDRTFYDYDFFRRDIPPSPLPFPQERTKYNRRANSTNEEKRRRKKKRKENGKRQKKRRRVEEGGGGRDGGERRGREGEETNKIDLFRSEFGNGLWKGVGRVSRNSMRIEDRGKG